MSAGDRPRDLTPEALAPLASLAPRDAEEILSLAHALRTPLTSLSLGLGLLDDGVLGPLNEAQHDVIRALVNETGRLSLLIDRALQTDRLGAYAGPIERERVDLAALLREATVPIAAQARHKRVEVALRAEEGIFLVADAVKLSWVITSLLGNALRYSPPSSVIELELVEAHGEAEIQVRDRGPGIPEARVGQIFERRGGRGLFLAREIVEAHGGRIQLRSGPGQGSIFTITLPAATEWEHDPGADGEESP